MREASQKITVRDEDLDSLCSHNMLVSMDYWIVTSFTGTFALLFFNALSGVRDESSDVDNQFYAQV
jgi:hypothetical protein